MEGQNLVDRQDQQGLHICPLTFSNLSLVCFLCSSRLKKTRFVSFLFFNICLCLFVCLFFYRSSPFCKLPRQLNYLVCSTRVFVFGRKKILETHPRIQPSPSTRIQKRLQILRDLFCIQGRVFGYRRIPKISPGAYIFQRLFLRGLYSDIRRGLSTEGNVRFKVDWASPIDGSKFTVLALFYFVFEGNFPSTSPWGLIFGGAI